MKIAICKAITVISYPPLAWAADGNILGYDGGAPSHVWSLSIRFQANVQAF
jgi:hypothetical protein